MPVLYLAPQSYFGNCVESSSFEIALEIVWPSMDVVWPALCLFYGIKEILPINFCHLILVETLGTGIIEPTTFQF